MVASIIYGAGVCIPFGFCHIKNCRVSVTFGVLSKCTAQTWLLSCTWGRGIAARIINSQECNKMLLRHTAMRLLARALWLSPSLPPPLQHGSVISEHSTELWDAGLLQTQMLWQQPGNYAPHARPYQMPQYDHAALTAGSPRSDPSMLRQYVLELRATRRQYYDALLRDKCQREMAGASPEESERYSAVLDQLSRDEDYFLRTGKSVTWQEIQALRGLKRKLQHYFGQAPSQESLAGLCEAQQQAAVYAQATGRDHGPQPGSWVTPFAHSQASQFGGKDMDWNMGRQGCVLQSPLVRPSHIRTT